MSSVNTDSLPEPFKYVQGGRKWSNKCDCKLPSPNDFLRETILSCEIHPTTEWFLRETKDMRGESAGVVWQSREKRHQNT